MRHDDSRRPEVIIADIDRTRSNIDRTLSALEARLEPRQLVDEGFNYLRRSGGGEFVANLGGAAKQNPLPIALAGIGIAWLMALGRRPAETYEEPSLSAPALREGISSVSSRATGAVSSMSARASGAVSSMRDRASHAAEATRQSWQRTRGGVGRLADEQPLAIAAIGFAIGAALAAAAPRTRTETRLMGDAAASLAEGAAEAVREPIGQARQAFEEGAGDWTRTTDPDAGASRH